MERQKEKGRSGKKRKDGKKEGKDKAVRRERTKQKDPLIQITNTLSKDIMINIIFIYYNI